MNQTPRVRQRQRVSGILDVRQKGINRRWIAQPAQTVAPLLLVLAASGALLAQTLEITSPADGAVAYSGKPLKVTVTAAGAFQLVALLVEHPLSSEQLLTAPPYQFTIEVPGTLASRSYGLSATGITASGKTVDIGPISVDVERPDLPYQLTTQLSALYMDYAGDSGNLIVYGKFADESTVDLTYSSRLTYASDTPAVATVDKKGLVTAIAPGKGNIAITYAGMSIRVPVNVMGPALVPGTVSLYAGQTQQLATWMALPPEVDQSVAWSINPQLGSIDKTGLYTASASVPSWRGVTVTATSVAVPTQSASAKVWIFPPVGIGLTPSTATLRAGQSLNFVAALANAGGGIKWSITPTGVGVTRPYTAPNSKNPLVPFPGLTYVAPATITSRQTVTVTATSVWDNSKTASAVVTLVP
jgi:hypothetical protein